MARKCDFSGWATRANLRCSDGRTIMKGAFEANDGKKVPLVWNHSHNDPQGVLGHAVLENRPEGVYAYCFFNDTPNAQAIKMAVQHGDITGLSIYANELKQQGGLVTHGNIRELSLVMAAANPGAFIDEVLAHGDDGDEGAIIYSGEPLCLVHSDDGKPQDDDKSGNDDKPRDDEETDPEDQEETVAQVYESLSDKQKKVVDYMVGQALVHSDEDDKQDQPPAEESEDEGGEHGGEEINHSDEGGDHVMKNNIFDQEQQETTRTDVLSHSDMAQIVKTARKDRSTLQTAIGQFVEGNDALQHGIEDIEALFPDYKDLQPGAPELITRDQSWVSAVMNKIHKSPFSRIRTRQMDARFASIRGKGYKKGKEKKPVGNMKLIKRTTDPQTVYVKDKLERDDILDIADFDVIEYQYGVMRQALNEEVATAILIGDGREDGDEDKISEEHIRSIWNDNDLYTIHVDLDMEKVRKELQGSNTSANFGENYIYAEAVITAALYAREDFKGSGTPDFFCTPHLLNVMLLARDLNGRRIYTTKAELVQALNVGEIHTVEQFEGLVRKDEDNKQHELLGIFVNLGDYSVGSTKGGEITRFNQFDIDFNQEKYLIETRLSGALTRLYSAIVLENPVSDEPSKPSVNTPAG